MEIDDNRGNAVKILGDFLSEISGDFTIGNIYSGTLDNIIPSEGEVFIFGVERKELEIISKEIEEKYENLSGNLSITLEETTGESYSND